MGATSSLGLCNFNIINYYILVLLFFAPGFLPFHVVSSNLSTRISDTRYTLFLGMLCICHYRDMVSLLIILQE